MSLFCVSVIAREKNQAASNDSVDRILWIFSIDINGYSIIIFKSNFTTNLLAVTFHSLHLHKGAKLDSNGSLDTQVKGREGKKYFATSVDVVRDKQVYRIVGFVTSIDFRKNYSESDFLIATSSAIGFIIWNVTFI